MTLSLNVKYFILSWIEFIKELNRFNNSYYIGHTIVTIVIHVTFYYKLCNVKKYLKIDVTVYIVHYSYMKIYLTVY